MEQLIFIVDDNDGNLAAAALALEDEYLVLTMPSAKKMFELLEKKRPDMILLDIEMPETGGFEAIATLKESPDWCGIPVIFLTGHSDDETKKQGVNLGAVDVITKPIVPDKLLMQVKSCFEKL